MFLYLYFRDQSGDLQAINRAGSYNCYKCMVKRELHSIQFEVICVHCNTPSAKLAVTRIVFSTPGAIPQSFYKLQVILQGCHSETLTCNVR